MSHLSPRYLYSEALPHGESPEWDALRGQQNSFDIFRSGRVLFEHQVNAYNINLCERKDVIDGRRVYRIARKDQFRLPTDAQGPFLFDTRVKNGKFRFTETDPTAGDTVLRNWKNFRT